MHLKLIKKLRELSCLEEQNEDTGIFMVKNCKYSIVPGYNEKHGVHVLFIDREIYMALESGKLLAGLEKLNEYMYPKVEDILNELPEEFKEFIVFNIEIFSKD
jgi:hypothetical protein